MNLIPTAEKQKVLIVHNFYQIPGGEDTVVANEKKLLEDNGHEVFLYTRHNSEINKMNIFRKLLLPFVSIYNPRTSREIKRIINENGIDVVHVHNTLNLISPSVYYAAVRCGVPVVQTVHNFRFICPGALLYRDGHICEDCIDKGFRCALNHGCYRGSRIQTFIIVLSSLIHRATGIYRKINFICLTEFNRQKLLYLNKKRNIIDPSGVLVKPNFTFFDTDNIAASETKRNFNNESFLYAGRLDETKGVKVLFEAWKIMGTNAPRLIVCGKGPLEDWCRCHAKELGNVEIKGFVESSVLSELISESSAVIVPTLLYEGFPMNIAEAFSAGVPVICSDIGNAGDLVEDGVTGWKFSVGSAEGLVGAVRKRMNSKNDISQNVKRVYNEKYTADVNYCRLKDIYGHLKTAEKKTAFLKRKNNL